MAKHVGKFCGIFNIVNNEKRFRINPFCIKKFSQENNQQCPEEFVSSGRFVPKTYEEFDQQRLLKPQQPLSPRLLRVSIIGEPNAGKSTLTNNLLNWKVCSVSKKVHTTKYNTTEVLVKGNTQVVFLDTPGLVTPQHGRKHNLDASLVIDPENSLLHTDIIGVVVDAVVSRKLSVPLLKLLNKNKEKKSILILNKVDKVDSKTRLLELTRTLTDGIVDGKASAKQDMIKIPKEDDLETLFQQTEKKLKNISDRSALSNEHCSNLGEECLVKKIGWPLFSRVFMISALEGEGVNEIKDYLLKSAYPSPWIYHDSIVTNQNPHEIAIMTVREKLLNFLPQEVPYTLKLVIEMWEETDDGLLNIAMSIICPRVKNMKLVIGSKGKTVSKIADAARQDLANTFRCDISLKLIIKTTT